MTFTDYDIHLFKKGEHCRLYEKMGARLDLDNPESGTYFSVWAPNAHKVSVVGDFNGWDTEANLLSVEHADSGVWEGKVQGTVKGSNYKYHIISKFNNYSVYKCDPFAFYCEESPETSSIVWDLSYKWEDSEWMRNRKEFNSLNAPMTVYEIHLGSWRRVVEEKNRFLTYRELACQLAEYIKDQGFTHVEFLPVMEHPFYGSWGYQMTGYFAPTSRYGNPQDFMYLIDYLHQSGIGVILDWVPSHFPTDEYGLGYFDGTHLYEHEDPRQGFHPDWKSAIFNCGRYEVKNFLLSSALFWLDKYHIDGLRIDAVASMIYLDYSRDEGEWIPNKYGGRENLESVDFIKQLNKTVYQLYPDVQTIAEESTSWPMVSRPVETGGLGFGMKWNMGWMHDMLEYFSRNTLYRKYHQNELTFSLLYAFTENFLISLSHDEVVHGKCSLLSKMPGDDWQKFANLRLLYGYMYAHPGKKLLFMGCEFGQKDEWDHDSSLDWHLLKNSHHLAIKSWVKALNKFYRNESLLFENDFNSESFEWIDFQDWQQSIISFIRKGANLKEVILVVCNMTPTLRYNYKVGVPFAAEWVEILNSDAKEFGGGGHVNKGKVESANVPVHGRENSVELVLPPLGILFFKTHHG